MDSKTTIGRRWTGEEVGELWNCDARRATVLIEAAEHEALAILIDDGGQPSYYRIENDQVPAFIAAATRSVDGSSVAVIVRRRSIIASKGGVVGPPPPPIVNDVLRASAVMAHHQLLALLELAVPGS